MFKDLENVIKLQKIDNQLLEIKGLKGDLPQTVNLLQQEINTLETSLCNDQSREKELILEVKNLQGKIQDSRILLERYQDQLYLVTSNKEYDSLTAEIDDTRQSIDRAEYHILELADEHENLKETIKTRQLTLTEKKLELQKKTTELDNTDKQTRTIQEKLYAEREQLVVQIPLRFMREYTRVSQARDGLAIVPIKQVFEERRDRKGNTEYIPLQVSCGGCHKIVPPQKAMEIRQGNQLIRCEFCGRLLYWDANSSEIHLNEEEEIF